MLFKRIGLDDFASAGVSQTILRHRLAVVLVTVFSVLVPFLEVAFIGNLYWIIDPTEEVALLNWFQTIFTAFLGVDSDSKIPVFGLAVGLLTLAVTSKVILRYLLAKIWYSVFLSASIGLISDYVEAPHYKVAFTDQQAISNATQRESEHYATFTINIVMLVALPISVAVFLIASYAISPLLAVLVMAIGVGVLALGWKRYQISYAIGARGVAMRAELLGFVTDIINGITSIKTRGAEARTAERSKKFISTTQRFRYESHINVLFVETITSTVILVALLGAVGIAAFNSQISAASVLIFVILMTRIQRLVQEFQGRIVKLRASLPSVQKLESLRAELQSTKELELDQVARKYSEPIVRVDLSNVTFSYPDRPEHQVVNNVSLTLHVGDRVLIEGPSGEGKSTLLQIVAGLLAPSAGEVAFNTVPFEICEYRGLRQRVGYVSGDMHLFSSSGRLNLDLAGELEKPDQERMIDAVRLTTRFAGRLDDPIGKNGSQLSLGQRQRLLLTHVFLNKFDLILMDEAISNVDPKLQRLVFQNLHDWISDDAIVINVAHHASGTMTYNRRFVFQAGKMTEY